jgi:hypothetical protein
VPGSWHLAASRPSTSSHWRSLDLAKPSGLLLLALLAPRFSCSHIASTACTLAAPAWAPCCRCWLGSPGPPHPTAAAEVDAAGCCEATTSAPLPAVMAAVLANSQGTTPSSSCTTAAACCSPTGCASPSTRADRTARLAWLSRTSRLVARVPWDRSWRMAGV